MKLMLPIEIETDADRRLCGATCLLKDRDEVACRIFGPLHGTGEEDEDGGDVTIRHEDCLRQALVVEMDEVLGGPNPAPRILVLRDSR